MSVFDTKKNVLLYEEWFKNHSSIFESEVNMLKSLLPSGFGFEIGIGTGLFAEKLNILMGNDPSCEMLKLANNRGRLTYNCKGENLPFHNKYFNSILLTTTICFLDNVTETLKEAYRVLKEKGSIIIGFIDKNSVIGQRYYNRRDNSLFYKDANFYSPQEIIKLLEDRNFKIVDIRQTLFDDIDNIKQVQSSKDGYGEGSFVAIKAIV